MKVFFTIKITKNFSAYEIWRQHPRGSFNMACSRLQAELGMIQPLVSAQRALPVVLAIHPDSGVGGHGGSSATWKQMSTGLRIKIPHVYIPVSTQLPTTQNCKIGTHKQTHERKHIHLLNKAECDGIYLYTCVSTRVCLRKWVGLGVEDSN